MKRKQINEHEEKTVQEKREFKEEGRLLKKKQALEIKKLHEIKEKKTKKLEAHGIPQKYLVELQKKKIE